MSNKILLIAGNYSPELTGIGKYNGEMIDWLSNNGYECTVLATYPYYPQWKVNKEYKRYSGWFKTENRNANSKPVTVIRCPHYVPALPSGIKRLISDASIFLSFAIALLPLLFKKKYDFVLSVAPPFTLGLLAIFYKKVKNANFLYHIQDLQIEAARDLGMIKSHRVIRLLFSIESYILKNADTISSISRNMMKRIYEKCLKDILFFPNWVDVDQFFPIPAKDFKVGYGFNLDDTIILYSGSIGEKQGLDQIIYTAQHFSDQRNLQFVICGDGPYKENLMKMSAKLNLENIHFLPLQPAAEFNKFLNIADFHLILQKTNAGDLVLPSKLTAVLAIGGVSIVAASPGTSLYDIITNNNLGYIIIPEDQQSLNLQLEIAIGSDNKSKSYNARQYASNYLSINSILKSYANTALKSMSIGTMNSDRIINYKKSSPMRKYETL